MNRKAVQTANDANHAKTRSLKGMGGGGTTSPAGVKKAFSESLSPFANFAYFAVFPAAYKLILSTHCWTPTR
jgi:hypothetical protein